MLRTPFHLMNACLLVVACVSMAGAAMPDQMQVFLKRYCVSCHGAEKQEGKLRLDTVRADGFREANLLAAMLEQLENGDMPPKEARARPKADESREVIEQLKTRLKMLGTVRPFKRLNQVEFQNTVNDLFGVDFDLVGDLPMDNIGIGFNNTGEKLSISPVAMEAYYKAASKIARAVVGPKPAPKVKILSAAQGDIVPFGQTQFFPQIRDETRALVLAEKNKTAGIVAMVDEAGYYRVQPHGYYLKTTYQAPASVTRQKSEETLDFIYFDPTLSKKDAVSVPNEEQMLQYRVSSFKGAHARGGLNEKFLLSDGFRVYIEPGQHVFLNSLHPDAVKKRKRPKPAKGQPSAPLPPEVRHMFCLESATLTGPIYETWPPRTPFYDTYFAEVKEADGMDQCESILRRLARQVFRRPTSGEMMKPFITCAQAEYDRGENIYTAVQSALNGMLCSPFFLFKHEGTGAALDDHAIAARMSYFFWNSLPDQQLFDLADAGKLQDPAVRKQQAVRMLKDKKSQRFARNFVSQWLYLDRLDEITPLEELVSMREFDHLRPSIAEEPYAFFGEVLNSNLSILNFIDSDFVMIDPTLNSLYQIEGFPEKSYKGRGKKKKVKGKKPAAKTVEEPVPEVGWTKVSLNESDTVRGGFVSQAGILLMTTNGEFTNPFYRGAWVIKSLYGDDLETPADLEVGTLKPTTEASTIKENIRLHREDASCSVCHVKMDPFGLALENYDIIGRWRENYRITQGKKTATRPVESGVEHMDRRKFSGPAGVKKIMLEDKEKITRAFIKKVFVYAMARETTYIDRDHLERTYQECVKNGYRLQDLLVDIVASKSFAKR